MLGCVTGANIIEFLTVAGGRSMSQPKNSAKPKVTIIASKGANQAINSRPETTIAK